MDSYHEIPRTLNHPLHGFRRHVRCGLEPHLQGMGKHDEPPLSIREDAGATKVLMGGTRCQWQHSVPKCQKQVCIVPWQCGSDISTPVTRLRGQSVMTGWGIIVVGRQTKVYRSTRPFVFAFVIREER